MKISTKLAPIGFVSAVEFHETVAAVLRGRSSRIPHLERVLNMRGRSGSDDR